jgi:signal transduction histidine kinase
VDAAAVFSTSLDLNQVLRQVAEQMARLLNIRGCAISDYNPETDTVQLISEFGPEQWDKEGHNFQPFPLDQYPQTKGVITTGKPALLHSNDPSLDSMELEYMDENNIKSLLMLPLRAQDRTIGLVELIDDQTYRFFNQREIELVQTLASHAATAIENARLYQRTQQYTTELEDRVQDRTLELSSAKESIEYILRSVPDSIFVLDDNDRVVQANPAGEALMRQAEEEGIDIFAPEFASGLTRLTTPAEKAVLKIRDRSYQALASSLDIEGSPGGTVVIFRDVTRFHELDEMKNQFVSDVSHELRTPLTNLNLYLDLLNKVTDPEKTKRYLATLRRETQRLTELIEDLLTISRLEAGRMEFDIEGVDVNRIVTELAVDRMQMAAQQELTLTYSIQPELPTARADSRLLTQVLSNLLTNALNYTPPKMSIHIETELKEWEGESWITICVKDTGLGIAPDEMEYLFTRFFRGSASQATNAPGTGLGLAISLEIIERLNGRITVESQLQKGSTFTVWLKAGL